MADRGRSRRPKGLTPRTAAVRRWFADSDLAKNMPEPDPDIVADICDYLVEEGVPLSRICKEKLVPNAPKLTELYFWQRSDPEIAKALGAAHAAAALALHDKLEADIHKEFDAAIEVGDKATIEAASKKMTLIERTRRFQVQKLLPAIYGDANEKVAMLKADIDSDAAAAKTVQEAIERMRDENGNVVIERVIEVPAKTAGAPTKAPTVKHSDQSEPDEPVALVIDMPQKIGGK